MIEIKNITKSYKNQTVLSDINVSIEGGQCVALIGPNGSGKTTLIKCILKLIKQDAGTISVNGKSISGQSQYRADIGYMPQISRFPGRMTVKELFLLIKGMRNQDGKKYDLDLYNALQIEKMVDKRLSELSGGMKQKVSVSLALLFNPNIIILDEPTAALDPVSNEIVKDKIKQCRAKGKIIIVSSHILSDLNEIATDVLYLYEGKQQFYKKLDDLREETTIQDLDKIITYLLKSQKIHV